ncbi:MAG TPA: hypothetical protein VFO03_04255 [Gaiellaceae bacterium]|nr:hypothetical protein [Gaiellaceae bacterium]
MSSDVLGGRRKGNQEVSMLHRRLAGVAAALLLVLVTAGSAYAATPQSIYRDLADNGRLDGHYTRADIERAFDVPTDLRTDALRIPRRPIRAPAAAEGGSASTGASRSGHRLPFSSLDAALLVAGGAPLLLIGAGLRRRLQPPSDAQAVGG